MSEQNFKLHDNLTDSGYYWFFYKINESLNHTICYFDSFSKTVTFVGGIDSIPVEQLKDLTSSWMGPIKVPTTEFSIENE